MKLKKLSGLLSAVLAGAMVLSMAPAAFAVATDELPAECDHIQQVAVDNHDGTCSYVCKVDGTVINTMEHIWDKDGTCVRGNAKKAATDTSDCEHTNNNWIYENLGDGTHNVVCKGCGETVSLAVPCVYTDGKCICGAEEPVHEHTSFKYENNGNGTHKVICADCGAVVTEAAECVYGEDGKGTCACGAEYACDHMGNHWKYVDNGDGTHNVVCADCGAVVSANVACNYKNGVCITCGAKQPAATKPGHGTIDPNFGVGYHPICEFFRAVFRFLFGRH